MHEIQPYRTKDGSLIRELMHPQHHGNANLSFALAEIEPGHATTRHVHRVSEEVYHVARGNGMMTLDEQSFPVGPGDTICILPNVAHTIENTGHELLVIFCCCAPPYSHADTEIDVKMG